MTDLKVKIGKTTFKNPIWVASGTFGSGKEFEDFLDLSTVGAIVAKTITLKKRTGNPAPRLCETASGLLNSIGLENNGLEYFLKENVPFLKSLKTDLIVSVAGETKEEFAELAEIISEKAAPAAIELNLSCPNVAHKTKKHTLFSQDAEETMKIISAARKKTKCPLIAKLTPNVTDIGEIAKAAEEAGSDALALVNTYFGMAVDATTMKPLLGNVVGGLSGPAIKPMALKAVYDAHKKVKIPIIGMGGIMSGSDVAEFMLCGAAAVELGTVNLIEPPAHGRIFSEFKAYLAGKKIRKVTELTGALVVC